MLKAVLLLLFSFSLIFNNGCSWSSDDKDESIEAAEAPEDGEEFDEEVIEGEESDDEDLEEFGEEELEEFGEEELEEDEDLEGDESLEGDEEIVELDDEDEGDEIDLGEEIGGENFGDEEIVDVDVDDAIEEAVEEGLPEEITTMEEDTSDVFAENTMEEESDIGEDVSFDDSASETPTRSFVPVKKIKTEPYAYKDGFINTVYIGREGDSVESISQKIFSTDMSSELLSINPHLRRGIKVGDKLYYKSPQRPQDSSQFLTYYEDRGVASDIYVSKKGENIRAISEQLLGNSRSWMEVWATNPDIESKWALAPGTELRYWQGEAAGMEMANNDGMSDTSNESMDDTGGDFATTDNSNDLPPPPPPIENNNNLGGSEPEVTITQGGNADGNIDIPPPPPPIENSFDDPIPPPSQGNNDFADNNNNGGGDGFIPPPVESKPPKKLKKKRKSGAGIGSFFSGKDGAFNMLVVAGVALILIALILIMIRKRRQSRRINLGETQI